MLAPSPRAELSLTGAVVYDIETLPNCMTMNVISFNDDSLDHTFEISDYRNDRVELLAWFNLWHKHQTIMIGFNTIAFDYPVLHQIWKAERYKVETVDGKLDCPQISVREIYEYAMRIIDSQTGRFGMTVWESERFAPQLDLYKVHHFDNRAKSTSLKALEFNMRSETVMEMPIPFGIPVTQEQIKNCVIPYNKHDVRETKKFGQFSKDAISLRLDLLNSGDVYGDVLNFSDTKIGGKLLEKRLGRDVCYDAETEAPKQTPRTEIKLSEIILPFIQFKHPEFVCVFDWMRQQTLNVDELTETIKTKGVFTGVKAHVGGLDFYFGTGGIHGSVEATRFAATDGYTIIDIDVKGLYPSIAIVNRFYPEHLGERFVEEYAKLPQERELYKKGTSKNLAFKLGANGTYGNSNNKYSVFYDPQFTMSITINGQLMLCMLAEWLLSVTSLELLMINTDGITYRVHERFAEHACIVRKIWERVTRLELEEAIYDRMWIRDVNNYLARDTKGKLKKKGAYWFPDVFPDDISAAACWHKDFSAQVIIKAAVAAMVDGADIGKFVRSHSDPFDFMLRAKVDRASKLYIDDKEQQRVTRYFISTNGGELFKVSPPKGTPGEFKKRNGVSDLDYRNVSLEIGSGVWDARIHTKNRSKYEERRIGIEAGALVTECNTASTFDWETLDYDWYVRGAEKLIIPG
jgi:hypothetical protein